MRAPVSAESMKLSVGGKTLKEPNNQLLESMPVTYSAITCEYLPLCGGMQTSSKVQDSNLADEPTTIDMDKFNALDEKIRKGDANDSDEERFEVLASVYAEKQVKDFNFSAEAQKQKLLEKHQSLKNDQEEDGDEQQIKNAQDFIQGNVENSQVPIEYIWA